MRSIRVIITVAVAIAAGVTVVAGQGRRTPASTARATPAEATTRIVAAAQALVATLDEAGRAKVQFPVEGPQTTRWSNLPTGIFKREGLRLGDLTATQRAAVTTLLKTALSPQGYQKVTGIMHGDEVLRRGQAGRGNGGGAAVVFGEDEDFLAFVGAPSTAERWTLQFGGHHLAINLTMGGSQATLAPSHTAAQPATYAIEGRTVRPLGAENDRAFTLINALDTTQRNQAILNYRVADLVLGPGQDGRTIQPEGIRASALTPAQQTMLLDLIREWAGIMNGAYADARMAEITASLPQTHFAWSGPTSSGSAAYFRIQGPALVIEYAPQRGVDHIHTIYRDPTNDYGTKFGRR